MADKDESSVLLSLNELMGLEEDRIATEEKTRAELEAAERVRLNAEAAAKRAQEESRLAQAEEARRVEDLRRREEEARVEAAAQGEIEKAKAEVEHRARMEQLAQAQRHEQSLAALKQDQGKKKLKMAVIATVSVLVLGGIGGVMAYNSSVKQAEMEKAALQAERQVQIEEAEKNMRRLEAMLKDAESMGASQKEALQAELLKAQQEAEAAKSDDGKKGTLELRGTFPAPGRLK
jgi:colicin import membrane protein